jgi:hypothetical protein
MWRTDQSNGGNYVNGRNLFINTGPPVLDLTDTSAMALNMLLNSDKYIFEEYRGESGCMMSAVFRRT